MGHHYIRLSGLQLPYRFQHLSRLSILLRQLLLLRLLVARHPAVTPAAVAVAAARQTSPYRFHHHHSRLARLLLLLLVAAAAAPVAAARLAPQVKLHHLQAVHVCRNDTARAQQGSNRPSVNGLSCKCSNTRRCPSGFLLASLHKDCVSVARCVSVRVWSPGFCHGVTLVTKASHKGAMVLDPRRKRPTCPPGSRKNTAGRPDMDLVYCTPAASSFSTSGPTSLTPRQKWRSRPPCSGRPLKGSCGGEYVWFSCVGTFHDRDPNARFPW